MDDAYSELDKLIHNCEYENQQYLKLIDHEKQLIDTYRKDTELNVKECERLQSAIDQFEQDVQTCNRQFHINKDNIESLKTTNHVLTEHVAAMNTKLKMTKEKREQQRLGHEKQLKHYQDIWQRYQTVYERFPLVPELQRITTMKDDLAKKIEEDQEKIVTTKQEISRLEGSQDICQMNGSQYIVKIAENRIENQKLLTQMVEMKAEIQTRMERQTNIEVENNTEKLTAIQLNDWIVHEQMDSSQMEPDAMSMEMVSPMISEKDDGDQMVTEDSVVSREPERCDAEMPSPELVGHVAAAEPPQTGHTEGQTNDNEQTMQVEEVQPEQQPNKTVVIFNKSTESVEIQLAREDMPHTADRQNMTYSTTCPSIDAPSMVPSCFPINVSSQRNVHCESGLLASEPHHTMAAKHFFVPKMPQSPCTKATVHQSWSPLLSPNHQASTSITSASRPRLQVPQVNFGSRCAIKTPQVVLNPRKTVMNTSNGTDETAPLVSKESTIESTFVVPENIRTKIMKGKMPAKSSSPLLVTKSPGMHSSMPRPQTFIPRLTVPPRLSVPAVGQNKKPLTVPAPHSVSSRVSLVQHNRPKTPLVPVSCQTGKNSDERPSPVKTASTLQPSAGECHEQSDSYYMPLKDKDSVDLMAKDSDTRKSPEHLQTEMNKKNSPFNIEKHKQRIAELKKSPGHPSLHTERRMFVGQNPSSEDKRKLMQTTFSQDSCLYPFIGAGDQNTNTADTDLGNENNTNITATGDADNILRKEQESAFENFFASFNSEEGKTPASFFQFSSPGKNDRSPTDGGGSVMQMFNQSTDKNDDKGNTGFNFNFNFEDAACNEEPEKDSAFRFNFGSDNNSKDGSDFFSMFGSDKETNDTGFNFNLENNDESSKKAASPVFRFNFG
ncbi:uncharacterized protein LOC128246507 isoform X2 [Mya arenaria]|uniref:uncharacterized protein LOC128246507 isoform X2 n=1 Tax=Mya arenaria TaxID=6604 RepID=UPI0022E51CF6|nr:uncharacterized protein LOC128246507 isoform X2 [Mya arenaria]